MKKTLLSLALLVGLFGCNASSIDMKKLMANSDKLLGAAKDMTAKEMTPSEEAEVGAASAALLLGGAPLYKNDKVERYVNQVGMWVAMQTGRKDIQWRFGVLDSPNVNAFAAPSGYVLVTRGLLVRLNNEAELAGVLAHEITHVVKRHYVFAYLKAQQLGGGVKLVQTAAESQGAIDQKTSAQIGNVFRGVYAKGLSEGDEFEADAGGVVYATRAGYDPYGLPRVLAMYASSDDSSVLSLLVSTHPDPNKRLDRLGAAMDEHFTEYETRGVRDTRQFRQIVALAKR